LPFTDLDAPGIARALAQIVERPEDVADVFLERREELELPPEDAAPGVRLRREEGLAVRLTRGRKTWLASTDRLAAKDFQDALRRVARAQPRLGYPLKQLQPSPWPEPPAAEEVLSFPAAVRRALRRRQARFRCRLVVRRHRRWLQVIGPRLASPVEREAFYSVVAETPWTRHGVLLTRLDDEAADGVARRLVRAYHCRDATPPEPWRGPCVLGPSAAAVLLHEAVAHALEADTLAAGGHPEAAVGVALGAAGLDVVDDPTSAPDAVRRTVDDEGMPALRRHLLRGGVVEQPLCDAVWARSSEVLAAGAGRRSDRHRPPAPRSTHLELAPGELAREELLAGAGGGLYLPVAERGHLDPLSGRFVLRFPYGRRIRNQTAGEPVGPAAMHGRVAELLQAITGIGSEARLAGAGWCAKGGMTLPVWATVPALRLEGVEVR